MSDEVHISPGYALGRLQRALEAVENHPDPAVRKRAENKVARWRAVIEGMASDTLAVGSRTPVADTPAWVTLEVAHGGFATGAYIAEGPLHEHEETLLAALPDDVRGTTARERLNLYYLGDDGQRVLLEAVRTGAYRVSVPEEAALPVAAWLTENDHADAALELVTVLRPLMHRLRFYPRLEARPRPAAATVRVSTAGEVRKGASENPSASADRRYERGASRVGSALRSFGRAVGRYR